MPLAIAFIIGGAVTVLVQSLVNDIIMPVITPLIPGGDWQTSTLKLTEDIVIAWGPFLAAFINFVIVAFVVFMVAKSILKEEKVTKK